MARRSRAALLTPPEPPTLRNVVELVRWHGSSEANALRDQCLALRLPEIDPSAVGWNVFRLLGLQVDEP